MEPNISPTPPNQKPTLDPVTPAPNPQTNPAASAGVDPVSAPTSAPASTSNDASAPASVLNPAKPASKPFYRQWQFYTIVILVIVAVAGWIFGAYGIQEGQTASGKVAGLENEIAEKNQLLVKYGTELGYKVDQYGRPIPEEKPTTPSDESEYIYIAEWGLKFKIPAQLKNVSYMYSGVEYYTETINRSTDVCVTGTVAEATGLPGFADLRHIGWSGLGCLGRFPIETDGEIVSEEWYQAQREAAVYEDDTYYYVFSAPQAAFSADPNELQWENKATQLVREMLTKNMSTFKVI